MFWFKISDLLSECINTITYGFLAHHSISLMIFMICFWNLHNNFISNGSSFSDLHYTRRIITWYSRWSNFAIHILNHPPVWINAMVHYSNYELRLLPVSAAHPHPHTNPHRFNTSADTGLTHFEWPAQFKSGFQTAQCSISPHTHTHIHTEKHLIAGGHFIWLSVLFFHV